MQHFFHAHLTLPASGHAAQVENSWLAAVDLMRTEAGASESALLEHALSSSCTCCARLWVNLAHASSRAGSLVQAERAARTALRLGLTTPLVRRVLADAVDAQGRAVEADGLHLRVASAAASSEQSHAHAQAHAQQEEDNQEDAATEYLALFFRFARRGRAGTALDCFRGAVRHAQNRAGVFQLAHLRQLQKQVSHL